MSPDKFDKTEKLSCGSLIQHGKYNDRIYLMKISDDFPPELPEMLIHIAKENHYGKIFAKIPAGKTKLFSKAGYITEASVPGFFSDIDDDGIFMSFFLDHNRTEEDKEQNYAENTALALERQDSGAAKLDASRFSIRRCNENDVDSMAEIYRKVFASYPFPIHDKNYILKTMRENVDYFCAETEGRIAALSSAEKDVTALAAEMTDFATLPEWRGNSLSVNLLKVMESEMKMQGIKTVYTIARAASPGMNITFSRMGYAFGGRLVNNTNISGNIESMNVWYKKFRI
ncbi:MAG: putative beta-lysine N-acetyltransferase [Victivallales bacterium]